MQTPIMKARVEGSLESAARAADPALTDASMSTLVRVALAVLADLRDSTGMIGRLVGEYGDRKPPGRPRKTVT